uniref:NADH dehydrogenase [ubiquinone] 1 alpha subcomplex assembly factor 3 n=1 Tax=Clytia hemisphaerica TaxID=252671 RepID=A0A7M5X8K0_9CNID|eukprot:TCONS_00020087-protein
MALFGQHIIRGSKQMSFHKKMRGTRLLCTSLQQQAADKQNKGTFMVEPTTMKIQKFAPESMSATDLPPVVGRYSTQGFHIQGNKLYGPVALLPRSFYSWKVKDASDITVKSLQLFTVAEPKIEILVIGTGLKIERLSQEVRDYMRRHNIALEVLDTPNACSTFNFLLEENRMPGAALIPPTDIPLY